MWPLSDLQRRMRDVVVSGNAASLASAIVGGADSARRFAIHERHYTTSLLAALMRRFPATGWLLGTSLVEEASREFIRHNPPSSPCIAEYGDGFARFLAAWPGAKHVAYVREFADLEWHLGRLAISVDRPPITRAACIAIPPDELPDAVVAIQTGTHYLHSSWPVDEILTLYLADAAPDRLTLVESDAWIEARGGRGSFRFLRLTAAEFSFRVALRAGLSLGEAVRRAWNHDETFDPGGALMAVVDAGLLTSVGRPPAEDQS